jgi:hypothetical protein
MRMSISIDSKAAQAQLRRWGGDFRDAVRRGVSRALASEAAEIKQQMRSHVAGQMSVVKRAFLKGFTARVLDRDPNPTLRRLPALYVGSGISWAGLHERGGVINGRMLIPLYGRVGRKRFKAQIAELMRGGNAYFIKNAKGNVVLMAENLAEHTRQRSTGLAGFKRRYRKAEGIKTLKRGADIPIAVLVPKVVLKKKLDIERLVAGRIPSLAAAVEKQIRELSA